MDLSSNFSFQKDGFSKSNEHPDIYVWKCPPMDFQFHYSIASHRFACDSLQLVAWGKAIEIKPISKHNFQESKSENIEYQTVEQHRCRGRRSESQMKDLQFKTYVPYSTLVSNDISLLFAPLISFTFYTGMVNINKQF